MATKKIKIAPERRAVKKVWNVSNWPSTSVRAQDVMVLGKVLTPGGAPVEIPEADLPRAHKLKALQEQGLIFIGDKLPVEYVRDAASRPRAHVPRAASRSHGRTHFQAEAEKQKAEAAKAPVVKKVEPKNEPEQKKEATEVDKPDAKRSKRR